MLPIAGHDNQLPIDITEISLKSGFEMGIRWIIKLALPVRIGLLVFMYLAPVTTLSDPIAAELHLDDEQLVGFADHLFKKQEYYRAISEYKRHQHFFPSSRLRQRSTLQIGRAYMAGGDYEKAIQFWQLQLEEPDKRVDSPNRIRILLGLSLLDIQKERPFRLRLENIDNAFQQFSRVSDVNTESRLIKDFRQDWETRPIPDYKSPWLAGGMSALLPGSGSYYTGRYLEGTYAFFLTLLFGWATHDAVQKDQPELAAVFGFFTLAFYGGNIYTAVNSVHKTNDKMDADELFRLRKKHGIWFIPDTGTGKSRF